MPYFYTNKYDSALENYNKSIVLRKILTRLSQCGDILLVSWHKQLALSFPRKTSERLSGDMLSTLYARGIMKRGFDAVFGILAVINENIR
jgi:hypothetical protein